MNRIKVTFKSWEQIADIIGWPEATEPEILQWIREHWSEEIVKEEE